MSIKSNILLASSGLISTCCNKLTVNYSHKKIISIKQINYTESNTDDFVSAKSHAREKPVLTGYEGKKKQSLMFPQIFMLFFCSDYLFFTFFIFPLANENERTIIT